VTAGLVFFLNNFRSIPEVVSSIGCLYTDEIDPT
jgi:hypothetical protein